MVNKQPYKIDNALAGGPPPLDESWWDAIMAEDDVHKPPPYRQATQRSAPNGRGFAAPQPSESLVLMDWDLAIELYEMDRIITLQVCGYNRGGLLVSGEGLQGFVPVSHLVELSAEKSAAEQELLLKEYTGRTLQLKVIECDPERGRVVFSERAALAESGSRTLLLHQLQPGQCIPGTVTNITDFGVFVDLGGVEGLIHVSELSWGRVRHPADVVHYGEEVKVHVINVDPDRSRVALSMKRLYSNPWETAETRYFPGQVTDAIITSLVPFGAFARLEEGLDGLIHISEICPGNPPASPSELLHEGQAVKVRVLHVDAFKQRLGLSMIVEE
jgi:small subunit ribosomal protein S1